MRGSPDGPRLGAFEGRHERVRPAASLRAEREERSAHFLRNSLRSETMAYEVHADHEVDRIAVRTHELARSHRAREEVRRFLAVECRDDHAPAVALLRDGARDLDEHGHGGRVVLGPPVDLVVDLAEVIEVSADEDVAIDIAAHLCEHVGAAAALHALLVWIEPGLAKRLDDDGAGGIALFRPCCPTGAFAAAQPFDQGPHWACIVALRRRGVPRLHAALFWSASSRRRAGRLVGLAGPGFFDIVGGSACD